MDGLRAHIAQLLRGVKRQRAWTIPGLTQLAGASSKWGEGTLAQGDCRRCEIALARRTGGTGSMRISLKTGCRMTYADVGAGRPVVLVHAFPLAGEMWALQID